MTTEEAITELAGLFPEPDYTSEVSLDTRGRADVTVFSNITECANVLYVDSPSLDECMKRVREQAEESKRLSKYANG